MKFWNYIKGERKGKDAHRIELDAMQDPLLGDAIEGFDKVGGEHAEALERLSARIAERTSAGGGKATGQHGRPGLRSSRLRNWSVAAAITALVCLTTGGLIYLNKSLYDNEQALTQGLRKSDSSHMDVILPPVNVIPNDTTALDDSKEKRRAAQASAITAQEDNEQISGHINVIRDPRIEIAETEIPDDFIVNDNGFGHQEFSSDIAAEEQTAMSETRIVAQAQREQTPAEKVTTDQAASQDAAPNAGIQTALQGKTAGVTTADRSSKITIRGRSSTRDESADRSVYGKVVDAETGEPIQGAVVAAEGTNSAAVTDTDGFFMLSEAGTEERVSASFLGYDPGTAQPDTSGYTLITMAPSTQALYDVVVTGYGTRKKSAMTGSVIGVPSLKDPTMTPEFREYLGKAIAAFPEEDRPEGSVIIEFEINNLGRPYRINVVETPSAKASREAKRILREGPDWDPEDIATHRIMIIF